MYCRGGFYSFYVFVLMAFIVLAIGMHFAKKGRELSEGVQTHLSIQMEILSHDLSNLGKTCIRRYGIDACRVLEFELEGYWMKFFLSSCEDRVCLVDFAIERISPLDSLLVRHTRREIWRLD
ncbi:hypothetical protein [Helicobacter pametensis]|uniref:hypothetical protein n=1 Tax=Helicobacter pametensis TaxID=95149 RepID=UPI0004891D27|nr:hypothetical protein [Helicobacter pametensis]